MRVDVWRDMGNQAASEKSVMDVLRLEHLTKDYCNEANKPVRILNIKEFTLHAKEQLGIEGLSGSGKSTLLNIIAGILTPTSGQVIVAGRDIASMTEANRDQWRATYIGYVFQTFNLLQGYTALENITLAQAFGKGVDSAFAKHLLDQVGLLALAHRKPSQLSIGQQQRIAVARALANKPQLVLADEPTGNLDSTHAKQIIDLIKRITQENKAALILVSHDQMMLKEFNKRITLSSINTV